jgi:serine/threonine protein kinase/tetratricopeptide (TPR) repeat protein
LSSDQINGSYLPKLERLMTSSNDDPNDITRSHLQLARDTTIGHYRVIEKIGAGGMGEVYLAEDTELNRKVALKFLPPNLCQDSDCRARFKREAQAAAKLNHPNIVTIYEVSEFNSRPFFAMEHVEGLRLDEYLKQKTPSLDKILDLAARVCEGLREAHSSGIVHRDIKPGNILVDKSGRVRILDFGLAAIKGVDKLTKTGSTLGTLNYMSPEQTRGELLDERSDIFSFGVVLYEMITGQLPFKGDHEPAIIYSIGYEELEPLARYKTGVTDELQRIVSKMLTKDKDERYQHIDDLLADLKHEKSRLESKPMGAEKPKKSRLRVALPISAVVVIAILVLVLKPWRLVIEPADETKAATKRVVVVPFRNQTGDPSLDPLGKMVADWTTQGLLQTGLAEVIPPERLLQLEETKSIRSIAKATGASMIVMGSYYKLGETIQFQAKVMDANEKILQAIEPITSETAKIMDGVESVRQWVLGALAVVVDKELKGLTGTGFRPPCYEAYKQYIRGRDLYEKQSDYTGAIEYFKRAHAIDTSFINPLIWLCNGYAKLGQSAQFDSLLRYLDLRRSQLTPLQQLEIDWISGWSSGDRMKALNAMREAARIAPGCTYAYDWGYQAFRVNRPRECIEAFKTANQEQQWLPYWDCFAASYHLLGEHKKELEIARQARKRFPDSFSPLNHEVRAFAALGKIEEIKKLIEESQTFTKPGFTTGSPGGTMRIAGEELRAHGDEDAAMTFLNQAIQWYRSRPTEELDSLFRDGYGLTLYYARRWEEAKSVFEELAKEAPDNTWCQRYIGCIAARQGDREKALKVSEWLRNLKQPHLGGHYTYYRACIAAILGDKDQAVTLLKENFLQGFGYSTDFHKDFDFESLWDYPPFIELLKPKG